MNYDAIRCTQPHPKIDGWICGAKLADVLPGSVTLEQGRDLRPGCLTLKCPKCRTEYVACPVNLVA